MNKIELHKNFIKSFEKLSIQDKQKVFDFLDLVKNSKSMVELPNVKKLSGYIFL